MSDLDVSRAKSETDAFLLQQQSSSWAHQTSSASWATSQIVSKLPKLEPGKSKPKLKESAGRMGKAIITNKGGIKKAFNDNFEIRTIKEV